MSKSNDTQRLSSGEQEEFLRFHYRNPQIYLELRQQALRDRGKGIYSIDLNKLLEQVKDPAIAILQKEPSLVSSFLLRYRTLLEADPSIWSMFRYEG